MRKERKVEKKMDNRKRRILQWGLNMASVKRRKERRKGEKEEKGEKKEKKMYMKGGKGINVALVMDDDKETEEEGREGKGQLGNDNTAMGSDYGLGGDRHAKEVGKGRDWKTRESAIVKTAMGN